MESYEVPKITQIGSLADTTLALHLSGAVDHIFTQIGHSTIIATTGHGPLNISVHIG